MKTCVFVVNHTVLVNGCPIQEIGIQRGLAQGYPLSFSLFLIVKERLNGLVVREQDLGMYSRFKVGNSRLAVSHL